MSTPKPIELDAERTKARGDSPMTSAEVLDELVWLLDGGTHPHLAAQMLGKSWEALTKAAERAGRSAEINRIDIDEWRRYTFGDRAGWARAA